MRKVPFATFIWGLVVHALSADGSLGQHVRTTSGMTISNAAAHERRQGLRWEWFEELFGHILKPLARRDKHPDCFYHGMRLLAVDGSKWSLRNTPAITAQSPPRHGNQHGHCAAFVKWSTSTLLEVGTHQPLAVARTLPGLAKEEGELNVSRRVLHGIPQDEDVLLLADRLYGNGRFIHDVATAAGARCQVLRRVGKALTPKVLQVLSDGSAIIEVSFRLPGHLGIKKIILREVRGRVWRSADPATPGAGKPKEPTEVRLWTTLLDEKKHTAEELIRLYAQRWEQELFFRELKRHTGREQLLRAGSLQGAEAEFGIMMVAASLLAGQRMQAAQLVGLPPVRISINKISAALEAMLPLLSVAGDIISPAQREKIIIKFMAHTAREARIPPRRSRSCQRALRKPICAWPLIRTREYLDGACVYVVTPISFP